MTDNRDAKGKRIVVGCRVHVPRRPNPMCPSYEDGLPSISGRVVRIDDNVVHIQEFKTFARRSVPAEVVRVQTGKTRDEKALAEAEQKGQRTR